LPKYFSRAAKFSDDQNDQKFRKNAQK